MDLTTATPAEIDTEINRINGEIARVMATVDQAEALIERIDAIKPGSYESFTPFYTPEKRAKAVALVEANLSAFEILRAEAAPLEARYAAERWTRYYLVTNTNGHVHTSTRCRTCFETTRFAWLTEQSGMSHANLTDLAGELSCAECFPNLPPEIMAKKTRIEDPAKRKTRLERDAAKDARLAKKIANGLTRDGSEFVIRYNDGGYRTISENAADGTSTRVWDDEAATRSEHFKTERAASMWWVDAHVYAYGKLTASKQAAYDSIIKAMADKHGKTFDEVKAEMDAKVAAKRKREGR